jgi:hypothetical protein
MLARRCQHGIGALQGAASMFSGRRADRIGGVRPPKKPVSGLWQIQCLPPGRLMARTRRGRVGAQVHDIYVAPRQRLVVGQDRGDAVARSQASAAPVRAAVAATSTLSSPGRVPGVQVRDETRAQ